MTGRVAPQELFSANPVEPLHFNEQVDGSPVLQAHHPATLRQTGVVHLELLDEKHNPDDVAPESSVGILDARDIVLKAVASQPQADRRVAVFQSPHTSKHARHDAFAQIVDTYSRELTGHITRLTGSVELAQDIVQDTFLAFITYADSFENRSEAALKAWLFRTARNRTFNTQRALSYRRAEPLEERVMLPQDVSAIARRGVPEEVAEQRETLREMGEILNGLLPHEKKAILLQSEGRTYLQISEALDKSVPAIKTLLARSRKKLNFQMRSKQLMVGLQD